MRSKEMFLCPRCEAELMKSLSVMPRLNYYDQPYRHIHCDKCANCGKTAWGDMFTVSDMRRAYDK